MKQIRYPAVHGSFYPDDPKELGALVKQLLDNAGAAQIPYSIGLIAPHAGFIYSGPVAAIAYAYLFPRAAAIRRVLLLGPAHRVAVDGIALSSATHFKTPLGITPLDLEAGEILKRLPFVHVLNDAHMEEHSLEVQLPFLQIILSDFSIVPALVGRTEASEVSAVIEAFNLDDNSVVVVSSDLSHYLPYARAREIDLKTATMIEGLAYEELSPEQACGAYPIRGLLHYAKQHNLRAITAGVANSGDTAGDHSRVVGYGSFVIY